MTIAQLGCWGLVACCSLAAIAASASSPEVTLPAPKTDGVMSVEAALAKRRSVRAYGKEALALANVSQLLWAGQGVSSPGGFRTAPSAGALYPLELYLVVGNVDELDTGVYKYVPSNHTLIHWRDGDRRGALSRAAWWQSSIKDATAVLVCTGVVERTQRKYGGRAERYMLIEVGHASQNVFLQAQSLNLGTVVVGAFRDRATKRVLALPENEEVLYLMPLGMRR